jgi:hypothetical protein
MPDEGSSLGELAYHSICGRLASQRSSILITYEIARQRPRDADRMIDSPGKSGGGGLDDC